MASPARGRKTSPGNNWTRKGDPPEGRLQVWRRYRAGWKIVKATPGAATVAKAREYIRDGVVVVFTPTHGRDGAMLFGRDPALLDSLREHLRDDPG